MTQTKIYRRNKVEELTGLATSTLYAEMSKGRFPRPIKLTGRAVGWRSADIENWLSSREAVEPFSLQ